jgi:inositol hexakisphosphate/diphosphoinositol-pentakisphosphate kinase
MYTVGPEYGHAEARKSPTVDGKVERNSEGKEIRFPVILTFREKEIARRIVLAFGQFVCGFDILRVQEGHNLVSYVCDVNGWSFVKNSRKYYEDCSQVLSEHMLALTKPDSLKRFSTLEPLLTRTVNRHDEDTFYSRAARMLQGEPEPEPRTENVAASSATTLTEMSAVPVRDLPAHLTSQPASLVQSEEDSDVDFTEQNKDSVTSKNSIVDYHEEELRCVIAIVRHGDRTPKQKLKVNMTEPHILEFFHKHTKDCKKDLKVKAKAPMTEFLKTVKTTLGELDPDNDSLRYQLTHMRDTLERWKIVGLNRKLQIKPKKFSKVVEGEKQRATSVQLVLKWGGNLTKLGERQSIRLGRTFRTEMYPGGGILRLHSTFRHDLKIKTSDEGRVMKTAAAFAKGLLELEGDLPPILVSLVHKEKGSMHMLDPSGNTEVKTELEDCKGKITANLQRDLDIQTASQEDLEQLVGPKELSALRSALRNVGNPRKTLFAIHRTMGDLLVELDEMQGAMGSGDELRIEGGEGLRGAEDDDVALSGVKLYKGETLLELTERWRFIHVRLYDAETDRFDLSRIPDVHDNVRFEYVCICVSCCLVLFNTNAFPACFIIRILACRYT